MGAPNHYSLELPQRCLKLIEGLLPQAEAVQNGPYGGLSTTFLLAMSTPMLVLPIERIWKPLDSDADAYVSERQILPLMTAEFTRLLNSPSLAALDFYRPGDWRYAEADYVPDMKLGHFYDEYLLKGMAKADATNRAARLPAAQWASCLRNALAHGGVLYLDANYEQASGKRTCRLAFVSGKYDRVDGVQHLKRLRALAISQEAYVDFLRRWTEWLGSIGLTFQEAA